MTDLFDDEIKEAAKTWTKEDVIETIKSWQFADEPESPISFLFNKLE